MLTENKDQDSHIKTARPVSGGAATPESVPLKAEEVALRTEKNPGTTPGLRRKDTGDSTREKGVPTQLNRVRACAPQSSQNPLILSILPLQRLCRPRAGRMELLWVSCDEEG